MKTSNIGKKATVGLENEFFTIDLEGNLKNNSDILMKSLENKKKIHKHLREELSFSMFEVCSDPKSTTPELAVSFLENLEEIINTAYEKDTYLLPLGCYPAKSKTKMRPKQRYKSQEIIFGKTNFSYAMKICGFHFHYSLPKGVVEKRTEHIRRLTYPGAKDIFLNMYNFSVAAEPACMTFCQSSPFLDGKHYGKDCRTLIYRDLVIPGDIHGLYHKLPIFGGLPYYEFTLEDVRDISSKRKNLFLDILHSNDFPTNEMVSQSDLRFMWGPIRVNNIGTLEYRGFDVNYPSYLFSTGLLIESALNALKSKDLQSLPSDIGINEPFKLEDNVVYLPPFSIVKSIELLSSRYGFDNSAVHSYCSAFYNFVLKVSDKKTHKKLKFIKKMLDDKKTLSDDILNLVKKNGYDVNNVPDDFLRYIALYYAKDFAKEVEIAKKFFSSL